LESRQKNKSEYVLRTRTRVQNAGVRMHSPSGLEPIT